MWGSATIAKELYYQAPDLKAIYFPIGTGSLAAGLDLARRALDWDVYLIGVVPEKCPTWKLSFDQKKPIQSVPGETQAEGLKIDFPPN